MLPVVSSDSAAEAIEAVIRDYVTGTEIHRTLERSSSALLRKSGLTGRRR